MTWKNDGHGLVTKSSEIKGYVPGHSWAMKLSQLAAQPGRMVRIATYSLNADYAAEVLGRRPTNVCVLCSDKFRDEAQRLKNLLPALAVETVDNLHAKMVLIEPDTVYVGSMNFVRPLLKDCVVGIRGAALHDHYAGLFDTWLAEGDRERDKPVKFQEKVRAEREHDEKILAKLVEFYPNAFSLTQPQPLKLRIDRDIFNDLHRRHDEDVRQNGWKGVSPYLRLLGNECPARTCPFENRAYGGDVAYALRLYTTSFAYLKATKCGGARINLRGEPDGLVTQREADFASELLMGMGVRVRL